MSPLGRAFLLRANAMVARVSIKDWKHDTARRVGLAPEGARPLGAFVYDSTNIGDEIQTLAALTLFPSHARPEPVNRDTFRLSSPITGRLPVAFNGWFTHGQRHWPPPPNIAPVLFGFHLSTTSILKSETTRFWFLRQGPVGCRDTHTRDTLESCGIPAFFSGCPTLGLRRPEIQRTDSVLVIDAHLPSRDGHNSDTRALYNRIVPGEIRARARPLSQNVPSFTNRMYGWKLRAAHRRLLDLAAASLVITNRLHVALPCLAMGTPCVLLHENPRKDTRLRDYLPHLHFASGEEALRDFDWAKPCARPLPVEFRSLADDYKSRLATALGTTGGSP